MPYPFNSKISFYVNVELNPSNQRDFQSESERNTYLANHHIVDFNDCTFVREGFVKIRDNWVDMNTINYMSFTNYYADDKSKRVFAYVTGAEYINANLVYVYFEIDVFQTYLFNMRWKPSFIERRHVANYLPNSGVPYVHTIPEGVDFGNAYVTVHKTVIPFTTGRTVMIASSIDIEKSGGSADNPSIVGSDGVTFDYTPNMLAYYIIGIPGTSSLQAFLSYFADRPWITQGFLFMTTIPDIFVYSSQGVVGSWIEPSVSISGVEGIEAVTCGKLKNGGFIQPHDYIVENFFDYFPPYDAGKLKLYPYSFIELSFENGSTMIIKPELIEGKDLRFKILPYIGVNTQIRAVPQNYAGEATNSQEGLTFSNFPNYPLQIDNYLLYMANNQNTIETTRQQMQSNLVYKTVKTGAQAILGGASQGVQGMNATTNYMNPVSMVNPGLATATAFTGFASSMINGAIDTYDVYRTGKQNIEMYESQIQDAEMKPPSLACGFGGEGYNTKYGYGLTVRWKTIRQEYRIILEDYFNRFGIKHHRFEVPNFRTRTTFDYLKITEPFIYGQIPFGHLQKLKRIFENGVWIWHTDNIGG